MFRRLCAFLLSAAAVLCACRGAPHCLAPSPARRRDHKMPRTLPRRTLLRVTRFERCRSDPGTRHGRGQHICGNRLRKIRSGHGIYAYVQIPGRRYFCLGKTRHPGHGLRRENDMRYRPGGERRHDTAP